MSLRIIHTSDWHLGKRLYKVSRIDEQVFFLNWLKKIIKEEKIDALLISGDIFDTPSPPSEALKIYFNFLNNVVHETKCHIYVLAGNHDSGKFIEAPSPFLHKERITVVGSINESLTENFHLIKSIDSKQKIALFMLPFFRSYDIWNLGKELGVGDIVNNIENRSHLFLEILEKMVKLFEEYANSHDCTTKLMMAHHLFAGFSYSGSEQGLALSGLESIPLNIFQNLDYLALGHIHQYQILKKENPASYYSGSPIPFRFGEKQNKVILKLHLDNKYSNFHVNQIKIPNFRKLFSLDLTLDNINSEIEQLSTSISAISTKEGFLPPLVEIKIHLDTHQALTIEEIKDKLKKLNVELVSIQFVRSRPLELSEEYNINHHDIPNTTELFKRFYSIKYPELKEIPPEIYEDFINIINDLDSGQERPLQSL